MKRWLAFFLVAVLFGITVGCSFPSPTANDVEVVFVNVGKGDACVIRIDGKVAVIDTGEAEKTAALIGVLNAMGIQTVDLLFLTHTHSDHIGGVPSLCKAVEVKDVYRAEISPEENGKNKIDKKVEECGLSTKKVAFGDRVSITDSVSFEVLGPLVYNDKDDNDNSLVLRLDVNGVSFLFAADMQIEEETSLISAGVRVKADVLKVGNHGNPDATSLLFATAVSPRIAVISTDTRVDTDSANPLVRERLSMATVYVTEQADLGLYVRVGTDGAIDVTELDGSVPTASVSIEKVDATEMSVLLANYGQEDVDMSGYMLVSEKTGEMFLFPEGTVLAAGESLSVSTAADADLVWDAEKPIKKNDSITLYDPFANEVSVGRTE